MSQVATEVDIHGGLLVGHDGSAAASAALGWAVATAARLGEPVHVLRTWSLSTAPRPSTYARGYVPPLADYETAVREALEADLAAVSVPEGVEVVLHVCHGSATRRLLEAGARADMLVVGSRGAGGFHGLRLGSTAEQVVRHAPCPTVVVPVSSPGDPEDLDRHVDHSDD